MMSPELPWGKAGSDEGTDILRINFPGFAEEKLRGIFVGEIFRKFEEKGLVFFFIKRSLSLLVKTYRISSS